MDGPACAGRHLAHTQLHKCKWDPQASFVSWPQPLTLSHPAQASAPLPTFPSRLFPISSLALSFIRGLRKLGFSLEFIKMECSRVEPASLLQPAQGPGSLPPPPPPRGHHTLPQRWAVSGL